MNFFVDFFKSIGYSFTLKVLKNMLRNYAYFDIDE